MHQKDCGVPRLCHQAQPTLHLPWTNILPVPRQNQVGEWVAWCFWSSVRKRAMHQADSRVARPGNTKRPTLYQHRTRRNRTECSGLPTVTVGLADCLGRIPPESHQNPTSDCTRRESPHHMVAYRAARPLTRIPILPTRRILQRTGLSTAGATGSAAGRRSPSHRPTDANPAPHSSPTAQTKKPRPKGLFLYGKINPNCSS